MKAINCIFAIKFYIMASPIKTNKKLPVRKRKSKKSKSALLWNRIKWVSIIVVFVGLGIWFGITFKEGIEYFFRSNKERISEKSVYDVRNVEVLSRHSDKMIGFDVSQYQGIISWSDVDSIAQHSMLEFVFIRSTMGVDGKDKAFELNWRGARANHFIRGAYHYYRPDENSAEQAHNFIKHVRLSEGDLPPVLDIEELPKRQSVDSLIVGLKRWMDIVEKEYKVQPILYSGEHYYSKNLKKWFPDHTIWIANYNFFVEEIKPEWHFWQFTEKGVVKGIDGKVDVNIFNGNRAEMRKLLVR